MSSAVEFTEFEALLDYLKHSRGFDFTAYKRLSLERRVTKRMQLIGVATYDQYLDYLEVHPDEFIHLFNTILINVTSFFRDSQAWEYIEKHIIPAIIAKKGPGERIRIWSAGCASGEEAYTLAMLLADQLGIDEYNERVKIYATDLDDDALAMARQANYSFKDVANVPEHFRERFFERIGNRFVFRADLRRVVIFGQHDLIQDAPIPRVDLLVCRNTLMYFNIEAQAKILTRLHFALSDEGYFFLGKAEMLFTHSNLFAPMELRQRIFTKVVKGNTRERLLLITQDAHPEPTAAIYESIRIREAAFEVDPLGAIVIDTSGGLLLANELARTMFNISLHDIGRPLQDLEISYRPVELRSCIETVYAEKRMLRLSDVEWFVQGDQRRYLDVQVIPLMDKGGNRLGIKVTFADVTRYNELQQELQHSKQELETAYEELQSSNEELVTVNEELQSTVEELETTNEELQATNEELETMNEELQSTNEELQTINDELRRRSSELNQANAFLESILSSMRGGVAVVDRDLAIYMWNQKSEDLWGLRAEEVYEQHLLNLDIGLPVDLLKQPVRACLTGELASEVTVNARNRRGKDFLCRVTCTPLMGAAASILGVILLMEEDGEHGDRS